jgi:hypothetical protein
MFPRFNKVVVEIWGDTRVDRSSLMIRQKYVVLTIIAIITIGYMNFAAGFALPFPQYDDFSNLVDWASAFSNATSLSNRFSLFFVAQAEHQQLLTKMIVAVQLVLTKHISLTQLILVGNLIWCAGVMYLLAIGYGALRNYWLVLPIAFLCLQPQTYDSIAFAAGMNNFAYLTLALIALYSIQKKGHWMVGFSIFIALISAFTAAPGFIVFFGLMVHLILEKRWKALAAVIAACLVSIIVYFMIGVHTPPFEKITGFGIAHLIKYFILFVGGAFGNLNILAGYILGVVLILTWIVICKHHKKVSPVLFSVATFCILVAASASFARSDFGLGQAVSSRYALISLILLSVTYFAIVQIVPSGKLRLITGLIALSIAVPFCVTNYMLYSPVIQSQKIVTSWNARAYFNGDRLASPHVVTTSLGKAVASGVWLDKKVAEEMSDKFPDLAVPVRVSFSLMDRNFDNISGGLELFEEAPGIVKLEGWAAISGKNMLFANRWVVFRKGDEAFLIPATPMFRAGPPYGIWDGFVAVVDPLSLPPGNYDVGIYIRSGEVKRIKMFRGISFTTGPDQYRDMLIGRYKTPGGIIALEQLADAKLTFVDSFGVRHFLKLRHGGLEIIDGEKTGKVNQNRSRIEWLNGDVWEKDSEWFENASEISLGKAVLGKWAQAVTKKWINGNKICRFEWRHNSVNGLVVINENGYSAQAYVDGDRLIIPVWNVFGEISDDAKYIHWSNGTAWHL